MAQSAVEARQLPELRVASLWVPGGTTLTALAIVGARRNFVPDDSYIFTGRTTT